MSQTLGDYLGCVCAISDDVPCSLCMARYEVDVRLRGRRLLELHAMRNAMDIDRKQVSDEIARLEAL